MPIQVKYYLLAAAWLEAEASYRLPFFGRSAAGIVARILRKEADILAASYVP